MDCANCGAKFQFNPAARPKHETSFNPGVAAVLSLVIPGAGQMYRGDVGTGIMWLLGVVAGYFMFVFPGIILHLICIFSAASRRA